MLFIALVAVAVWLADLRLAVALPLVGLAWAIAALIEWLAWRSAREYETHPAVPAAPAATLPPPAVPGPIQAEPEPVDAAPLRDWAPPEAVVPEPPPAPASVAEERAAEPEPEPTPEPDEPTLADIEPEVRVEEEPELTPEPEPDHEPEQLTVVEPVPAVVVEPDKPASWARRMRLRAVPSPPAEPRAPAPVPVAPVRQADSRVVSLPQRGRPARQWNLWDLERLAREESQRHPERREEWAFFFVHLRQFANADGELPREFDSLVRESFGGLLERQPSG